MCDYKDTVKNLTVRLSKVPAIKNNETGHTTGYIGLIVRDFSIRNIDVINNCKTTKDIIRILKLTIKQLEKKEK